MLKKTHAWLLLTLVAWVIMSTTSWACEGCVNFDSISAGQNVKMVQAGFSWSVLFMIGVPMLLIVGLYRMMVKACQKADEQIAERARKSGS